ncbi:MAG: Ig-like domain-containing protein [Gemmatimonadota bacterium]|nr:Ig-like domain-containing protein [Gemmatimonadota bacterium]
MSIKACSARTLPIVLLLLAACGDGDKGTGPADADEPNQAPRAVEDIADLDLIIGEGDAKVDVSEYFRDGDGDALTFTAVSSDESVAAVSMSGSTLTVRSVSPGDATITVTATDPGGLSATRRFRVYVETLDPNLTGPYEPLDWVSVTPGRIVWRPLSSLPLSCLSWTEATVNGVTYRIHVSHWQKRGSSTSSWTDIPGTRRVQRMCGYTPTGTGEYRLVMELSINRVRGRYASSNVIIAFCDRGECRFF